MITCMECGSPSRLTDGREVFPARKDLWKKKFWVCPCGARVGCHDGTDRPKGAPGDVATRAARVEAHRVFDHLWQRGEMTRHEAYSWLAHRLGIPRASCHIGFMDERTALRVARIAASRPVAVRAYKCVVCGVLHETYLAAEACCSDGHA
jgi:hypothetical protein